MENVSHVSKRRGHQPLCKTVQNKTFQTGCQQAPISGLQSQFSTCTHF